MALLSLGFDFIDLDGPWVQVDINRSPDGSRLYCASLAGLQDSSLSLLEGGANPNAEGGQFHSALRVAASHGHEQIVRLLLEQGADVNLQGGRYGSVLQAAAYHGDEQVV
ncbi:hypothetical protein HETIRDRAFT_47466 [Heterobasidion irregulare TC 32-1]|uniref:Uncharacterized protein n=1 Tax=Heterobasidion irregulare (strain TC 32-1) TaxID=747525 RepID=W4KF13_HETIT|nr:uncharacterized protein HETIRDRAFT_47466 [Heterobasidion irregulare TC 32-1]ETW83656.1 hypothetical protein HETIRDRAFT_47466 [Heterobasidion irregulare TC 32-1]